MPGNRRFVLGVDLDGVCADFYGGLKPVAAEWLGVELASLPDRVSWTLPEWGVDQAPGGYDALHRFAVTQRELFRRLPPMPGARSGADHSSSTRNSSPPRATKLSGCPTTIRSPSPST